ncbi:hypothetical protein LQZ19_07470 [Treponema primitia]|uniref:hypothetical protein n=1 Tax=Treponema primitia TaxID=88058 RepID=UPI0039807322
MISHKALSIVLLFIILLPLGLRAQTVSTTEAPEFPLWARDLRRAEIIAFGSFPFMMFLSNFTVDTYRASNHEWDNRYMPWPLKGAGAVEMSTDEHVLTLGVAIAGSLVLALADHLIFRYKRANAERRDRLLPEGEPIILRKPWPIDDKAQSPDTAAAGTP